MSVMENIPCDVEAAKQMRLAIVMKYGKMHGYYGKEISQAVNERAKKIMDELKE